MFKNGLLAHQIRNEACELFKEKLNGQKVWTKK